MGAYDFNFDVPAGERYSPSPERVRAWQAILPDGPFGFGPPITERAAWESWRNDSLGQSFLKRAREMAATPFPDYTDATFIDCLEREDVTKINTVMPETRERQFVLLIAEAIFDEGEFIAVLAEDVRRVSELSTWVHPGNDLQRLNFDQKTIEIDLVVAHFGTHFANMEFILGPRLPDKLRALLRSEVQRRVFEPLRQRLESGRDLYWWIDVTHNWNSVCLACIAGAAAGLLPPSERAWWMAASEMLVKNSRDGFNNDGVCTEGIGYWSYGLSHYIILSELLRLGTKGVVDLLDEPRMSRVALFPDRVEIEPGLFPTYADCRIGTQPKFWVRHWLDNRRGAEIETTQPIPEADVPVGPDMKQSAPEALLWMFHTIDPRHPRGTSRPVALRNWFKDSSLLVCRPAPATGRRLSATLMGGHNGVNHNHNDLGTFTVVLDGRALIVDPGMETYSFRTFSTERYESPLLNSYGHPVPRVAGKLQEAGPEWQTRVLLTEFSDEVDRVVFDLRRAYDVPTLRRLEREFVYDRRGEGSVTIIDRVEFSEPAAFESALITFGQCAMDGAHLTLTDGPTTLKGEISIEGAELEIATDTINQPPHPIRIALRCGSEVRQATIRTLLKG